ncbi:MAG TPA: DUF5658 family protein [Candidatus Aquicultor sp.]|jgi:hypothetical protein
MDNSLKLLFALNMTDIVLTRHLTSRGAVELNPIINYLLTVNFVWALLFKVLVSVVFITIVMRLKDQVASMRSLVLGTNIFLALLVVYQLIGVAALS